jgi:hypothetical protein
MKHAFLTLATASISRAVQLQQERKQTQQKCKTNRINANKYHMYPNANGPVAAVATLAAVGQSPPSYTLSTLPA